MPDPVQLDLVPSPEPVVDPLGEIGAYPIARDGFVLKSQHRFKDCRRGMRGVTMQPDLDPRDGRYRLFPRWFTILELRLPFSEKPSIRVQFERGGGNWTFRSLGEFQLEVELRKGF